MIKNYILIAIRNLLRNKTVSFINIFGLAVSMSVCLLLILIVADQYAYDNFHDKKDRIYRIVTDRTQLKEYEWSTASTAYPLADLVKTHESVEKAAIIKNHFDGVATWGDAEIPFDGLYTNNDFFDVFSFPLVQGNAAEVFSLPNSLVLTQELARKIFGDKNPINETIEVEELGEFIVTGVLGQFPGKTHMEFEALASVNYLPILEKEGKLITSLNSWDNIYDSYIYVLEKPGADINSINQILYKASQEHYNKEGEYEYDFKIQALNDITPGPLLSNNLGFGLPMLFVYFQLALALIVLLSACFNYANLTTARAINRAKEIGVRKVVGARKTQVVGQFMVEAIIVALVAFILADLIVQFLHPQLNNIIGKYAPFRFDETPNLYPIYFGFALLTGVIAGVAPSLFFAAINPLSALKKSVNIGALGKHFGFMKFNVRKVLVVVQFAFSIFFVITITTIYQQMNFVMKTNHGFKTEGVINVRLQGMDYETMRNEFSQLANVQAVAATTHMPALGTNNGTEVKLEGEEEPKYISYFGVDNAYVESMGLKLVAGKNFPELMPDEERFILINEQAVKDFGWSDNYDAVGKVMTINKKPLEVIGVLKDFHYERLDEEIGAMGLRYQPEEAGSMIVTVSPEKSKETIAQLEAGWKKHTNRPFEYTFYEDDMELSYGHFSALIKVLGYVTAIVVSIACLGLLGMVIFHIQNKTKEIGIRKTLGAEAKDILLTIGKSFLLLILIAYLIGGPLSYFVNDLWLQSYAYRIDFGLPTLLIGFLTVLFVVAVTVGSQLFKAMRINPVDSLRNE